MIKDILNKLQSDNEWLRKNQSRLQKALNKIGIERDEAVDDAKRKGDLLQKWIMAALSGDNFGRVAQEVVPWRLSEAIANSQAKERELTDRVSTLRARLNGVAKAARDLFNRDWHSCTGIECYNCRVGEALMAADIIDE